jgi:NAD+ synthase
VKWIKAYARSAKIRTLVVGISGGIDSSVVSALCARTGLKTIVVQMPIRQNRTLDNRSSMQAGWLRDRYPDTVTHMSMDLTPVFAAFEKKVDPYCGIEDDTYGTYQLASANSRARLRMMTLYQIAQCNRGIVVGTGNRVEDFGVGFFTKYGDGGVDISPIGDCMKTDVWAMGQCLNIDPAIIAAPPTDGLWADGRTDEDQLGMRYPELETMMQMSEAGFKVAPTGIFVPTTWEQVIRSCGATKKPQPGFSPITRRQQRRRWATKGSAARLASGWPSPASAIAGQGGGLLPL